MDVANSIPPKVNLRVLIVENDFDCAQAMMKLLSYKGHAVQIAATVNAALSLIANQAFDIIVSDIMLADGNGYDLMKVVRSQFGVKGIALSGRGMEEDFAKSMEAGFEQHLVKPVDIDELDAALRGVKLENRYR